MTTTTQRASAPAAIRPHGTPVRATLILSIICVSYLVVILGNSIVFTGLPQIRSDMGFSETGLSWITNAHVLVLGGLLLLGARAGDLFGHTGVSLGARGTPCGGRTVSAEAARPRAGCGCATRRGAVSAGPIRPSS